jgi:hypothetical protein
LGRMFSGRCKTGLYPVLRYMRRGKGAQVPVQYTGAGKPLLP